MKIINKKVWLVAAIALIAGIIIGSFVFRGKAVVMGDNHEDHDHSSTTWTCSMHPQIRQPEPGQCPICGMDLIPLAEDAAGAENPMMVQMSESAVRLAKIQTIVVGEGSTAKTLRLNGKIVPNERFVKTQASHVGGRVEQLFVNTTGEQIKSGQKLADLYSPELITAQQELLQGVSIKESQPALYRAAREKLKSLRLTEKQIDNIEANKKVQENIAVFADRSGIVLKKMVNVGDYLKKGDALFTIADLSRLWVVFDAYESDLTFLNKGDKISFTVASVPGKVFSGTIAFIDPIVSQQTRTAEVRVEITNDGGVLKPEMFATATVEAKLGNKAELIVPKTAVMWTGERSVVYVQMADAESNGFQLREVTLGPSLGDAYVINDGLKAGERIVTHGTFTVDAAAQLAGKPSMMNIEGGVAMTGHNHGGSEMNNKTQPTSNTEATAKLEISGSTKKEIYTVLQSYFKLKDALVASQKQDAAETAKQLQQSIDAVSMGKMKPEAHEQWMKVLPLMKSSLSKINAKSNIDVQRKAFVVLSKSIVGVAQAFGPFDQPIYVLNCPMADSNAGADWLSASEEVMNPYYGDMMLKCGDVKTKIQ